MPIYHDDVVKCKLCSRDWPFVRGIHRPLVNSLHKGLWRGALLFPLIRAWVNGWANNHEAGDLTPHLAYYDVTLMIYLPESFHSNMNLPTSVVSILIYIYLPVSFPYQWVFTSLCRFHANMYSPTCVVSVPICIYLPMRFPCQYVFTCLCRSHVNLYLHTSVVSVPIYQNATIQSISNLFMNYLNRVI